MALERPTFQGPDRLKLARSGWLFPVIVLAVFSICIGGGLVLLVRPAPQSGQTSIAISGDFPGEPVWVFETQETIVSALGIQGSAVYVQDVDTLYALDTASGEEVWHISLPGGSSESQSPTALGDVLLAPEWYGTLRAVSAESGELLWQHSPQDSPPPVLNTNKGPVQAVQPTHQTPVVDIAFGKDVAYVTRFNWLLTAYDLENGDILWEARLPGRDSVYLIADQAVLYATIEDALEVYDAHSGNLLWREGFGTPTGAMILDERILYMIRGYDVATKLLAFDIDSRTILWESDFPSSQPTVRNYLLLNEDTLYLANDSLSAVSTANGDVIWQSRRIGSLGPPVVLNQTVYVKSGASTLYAFDSSDGHETGSVESRTPLSLRQPRKSAEYGPVVAGDFLVVPLGSNEVYAFQP